MLIPISRSAHDANRTPQANRVEFIKKLFGRGIIIDHLDEDLNCPIQLVVVATRPWKSDSNWDMIL